MRSPSPMPATTAGLTTRQAYDLPPKGSGPGSTARSCSPPRCRPAAARQPLPRLTMPCARRRGWHSSRRPSSTRPRHGGDHRVSDQSPQSAQTEDLVHRLRSQVLPAATAGRVSRYWWEGRRRQRRRLELPLVAPVPRDRRGARPVVHPLMAAFRLLAIPLKAGSGEPALGRRRLRVIVAVFQWGWLGGVDRHRCNRADRPVDPLMMFTILFGLSMDYEVFLLSPHARRMAAGPTTTPRRWPTVWPDRARDHRGGGHHDLRCR